MCDLISVITTLLLFVVVISRLC